MLQAWRHEHSISITRAAVEAFLSGVQLTQQIISLVEANPSAALYVGSALLGASIGTAIVRNSEGALIGAGVGLLIAGILQAVNANGRPPAED